MESQNTKVGNFAAIHESAVIGNNVLIGNNVTINPNVTIGDNTVIGHNVVLGEPESSYYSSPINHKFSDLIIGKDCIIRSGSVIYEGSTFEDKFQTGPMVSIRERN